MVSSWWGSNSNGGCCSIVKVLNNRTTFCFEANEIDKNRLHIDELGRKADFDYDDISYNWSTKNVKSVTLQVMISLRGYYYTKLEF